MEGKTETTQVNWPSFFSLSSITSAVLLPWVSGRTQHMIAPMNDKAPITAKGSTELIRVIWTTNGELAAPIRLATDTIPMPLFLNTLIKKKEKKKNNLT